MTDGLAPWSGRGGRIEAWFLTTSSPDGRRGYWLRYTIRAPIAGPPEGRLWFAAFDRDDGGWTFGVNAAARGEPRVSGDRATVALDDAILEPGRADGAVEAAGRRVRWTLSWDGAVRRVAIVPPVIARLRGGGLTAPDPDIRCSGEIEIDGVVQRLDDFPAQQGHHSARRHPERWAWASCTAYEGSASLDAICAQDRRGPLLTPFVTFATVRVDERRLRLRGVSRIRPWNLGSWRLRLSDRYHRLEADVSAPRDTLIRARYLDPDDTPRWCHNSEVSSSRLRVWERAAGGWQQIADLGSEGTTHAEWAGRTPAPGVGRVFQEAA